jgi:carbamoyltransferase
MKTILSLTNHLESSVCLIHKKKILAVSEERFTRNKNQDGMPILAINWVLSKAKIKLSDCDKIVYCSAKSIYPSKDQEKQFLSELINSKNKYNQKIILHRMLSEVVYNSKAISSFKEWIALNNISERKIKYLDHHTAHAKSVLNFYKLKDATIFTCDGKGSFVSSAVWDYKNKILKNSNFNLSHNSLGYMYGNFTISLGYKAERHEGKLTGLAAYSKPINGYKKINPFKIQGKKIVTRKFEGIYMPFFDRERNSRWNISKFKSLTSNAKPEQVASTAQKILENVLIKWIQKNLKKNTKNICLSGGVFSNVRLNQQIKEKFKEQIIYVNPAMSDLGLVLGGADIKSFKLSDNKGVYLGPNFNTRKISSKLKNRYKWIKLKSISEAVTKTIELFEKKLPIGIFQGEMEFGPRALGNRSIIYHAKDVTCNKWMNKKLNRSEFMPFAPVILDIHANKYLKNYNKNQKTAEFMTITYYCTNEFKKKSPAAVHTDGTIRPQVLNRNKNPWFYDFLYQYLNITDEACLLNTSFNNHEEPIVCSLEDALNSLDLGNVNAILYAKKYLITKK